LSIANVLFYEPIICFAIYFHSDDVNLFDLVYCYLILDFIPCANLYRFALIIKWAYRAFVLSI